MCGLVGIMTTSAANNKQLQLLSNLLFVDKIRGEHATGIAKINTWNNTVKVHKKAMGATQFLGLEETHEFLDKERGRIYLGHNRYATMGDKSKHENAHPFTVDHVTLVHNGGVDRWTLDKLVGYDDPDYTVDSHMVTATIAKHGIEEAIKLFSGAFALIWWDAKDFTLNFIRNNERPLWMAELNDGTLVWASEKEFLDFFVGHKRSGFTYKVAPVELPVDTLITYSFTKHGVLMNGKPAAKKLSFTKVVDPNPPKSWNNYYENYNHGGRGTNYTPAARGPDQWDARANAILAFWSLTERVGSRITFKIETIEDTANQAKVNVWGVFEGMDTVLYFVDRKVVEGAKYLSSVILNCHESTVDYNGTKTKEPRITLKADGFRVEQGPAAKLKPVERASIALNTFPMKAQGHTFQTREEFVDFVSAGCSMCGVTPTTYNVNNKLITIYGVNDSGAAPGSLSECEFICGNCVKESAEETANV